VSENKKKKSSKYHNHGRFHGDIWLSTHVHDWTERSVQRIMKNFPVQHRNDTDEELIEYLKRELQKVKVIPHYKEVPGGELIANRFHGWDRALKLAGLRPCHVSSPRDMRAWPIYKKEYFVQQDAFRKHHAEKMDRTRQKRKMEAMEAKLAAEAAAASAALDDERQLPALLEGNQVSGAAE